ncbi:hypothetical protein BBBOND_0102490 [Babesia bigemina]|uniref:Uncharacterized protein n=1 Tax=Babesia bigemina TaxID=5866 RepID=A0A061D868_BABBI|nr:hypothetical protein BBBOND_0102490 [Babesia bigemina]CDR93920.1 hypothetical protein BBBOND_0102490 [Babesia bigemina]|eukprot:XP_012766106.1 hypothetical protein BBBOND_0102490 [Babesia bigemina]
MGAAQGKLTEGEHDKCNGSQNRCHKICPKCTLFCDCKCCPRGAGIAIFCTFMAVFIVLSLIIWYGRWYQKPIDNLRSYFREYRNTYNAEPLIKNYSS